MFAFFSTASGAIGSLIVRGGSLVFDSRSARLRSFLDRRYGHTPAVPLFPTRKFLTPIHHRRRSGGPERGTGARRCLRRVLVCDAGHPRNEPAASSTGSSPATVRRPRIPANLPRSVAALRDD